MLTSIAVMGYGFILPADTTTFALQLIGRGLDEAWHDAAETAAQFDAWLSQEAIEHASADFQMMVCGSSDQVLVAVLVRSSVTSVRMGRQSFIDSDFDFAAGYRNVYGVDLARLRYSLDSPEAEIGWHLLTRS